MKPTRYPRSGALALLWAALKYLVNPRKTERDLWQALDWRRRNAEKAGEA